jgi:hypothetical protein
MSLKQVAVILTIGFTYCASGYAKPEYQRANDAAEAVRKLGFAIHGHDNTGSCSRSRGLHGWYDPRDRALHLCNWNIEAGGLWNMVLMHEMTHAAQHCIGNSLDTHPRLKHYLKRPIVSWEKQEVVELYPPKQWKFEEEARRISYSLVLEEAVEMLRIACEPWKSN